MTRRRNRPRRPQRVPGDRSFRTWPERGLLVMAGNDGCGVATQYLFRRVERWDAGTRRWVPTGEVLEGAAAAPRTLSRRRA